MCSGSFARSILCGGEFIVCWLGVELGGSAWLPVHCFLSICQDDLNDGVNVNQD